MIFFPHGEQHGDEKSYSQEYNQQKTYSSECKLGCSCGMEERIYAVLESLTDARLVRLLRGLVRGS
jgi:hypothetical protein